MPILMMIARLALAASLALATPAHAGYGVTQAMPVPNADAEVAAESLRNGDWQRAIDGFQAALRAEPDNAEFHDGLACAYLKRGSRELAFRHFREALRIDPNLRSAHAATGRRRVSTSRPSSRSAPAARARNTSTSSARSRPRSERRRDAAGRSVCIGVRRL
jgi:cytochrome c-type biogenesis protein CcmH/NrfG